MTLNHTQRPAKPIRVLIVDDHSVVRSGLSAFLMIHPDMELVAEAGNGAEAVQLCDVLRPDVVLMDLMMQEMDGITATKIIRQRNPHIQVVALTSFWDETLVHQALQAGIIGYLLKNVTADTLANAIRAAVEKRPTLAYEVTEVLIRSATGPSPTNYGLTEREHKILELIIAGLSNPQIAEQLFISRSTVKFHTSNILSKLGVKSRLEAVTFALQNHLIERNT